MTHLILYIFSILFLIRIANCLQDNLDSTLANVEIDNPLIQLNREFIQGENEALTLLRTSKLSTNNSQITSIDSQSKPSDLSCYTCTTNDDSSCEHVNLTRNSDLVKKCKPNEPYCSVLRIEYKIVKEANWTLWLVERSCLETCEEICIKLGERTRLKFCQTCCNESQCNVGNREQIVRSDLVLILILLSVFFVN